MQFVNKEAGEKRRQHYCEALTKEALNKYYPPIQEVFNMIFTLRKSSKYWDRKV